MWQRVLPLLHRLVVASERGAPSKADRAAVLARLLDFPRLLDVCALYCATAGDSSGGSSSSGQLPQVVAAALQLLPRLASQAAAAGPLLAENLSQVTEACLSAAGKAGRDAAMAQSLQGERAGVRGGLAGPLHLPPRSLPLPTPLLPTARPPPTSTLPQMALAISGTHA